MEADPIYNLIVLALVFGVVAGPLCLIGLVLEWIGR